MFAKNIGAIDRTFRVLFGAGLLSLAFVGPETAWGYVGLIPLLTGLLQSCPLYSLFGFSTCPLSKSQTQKN